MLGIRKKQFSEFPGQSLLLVVFYDAEFGLVLGPRAGQPQLRRSPNNDFR
jgi:hypothetical protein